MNQNQMNHPAFFDQAPTITLHDGLAELLDAFHDGMITYRYVDAVRLAGHSCPTVAGAYLMARRALNLLYPDRTPERGAIKVRFSARADEGVTGVVGSIIGLITGAAGTGGFKGIGGQFRRQSSMYFANKAVSAVSFERIDNGVSVQLAMQMNRVKADPRIGALMKKIVEGVSAEKERNEFAMLWQDRVQRILIDHANDPKLIATVAGKSY